MIAWLTEGCEMKSLDAAALILPLVTTSIKILKCLIVTFYLPTYQKLIDFNLILIGFTYNNDKILSFYCLLNNCYIVIDEYFLYGG